MGAPSVPTDKCAAFSAGGFKQPGILHARFALPVVAAVVLRLFFATVLLAACGRWSQRDTRSVAGAVPQQHERFAVADTIPPMLSSYRAVLFRDGRVAIQVHVGDRQSGVSESGVATHYSLNGGKTWLRQVHSSIEDDFGRPATFETTLGPFEGGTELLIGVSARDLVGNTSRGLPVDAGVLVAPMNMERVLDTFGSSGVDGNPVFSHEAIARLAVWIDTAHVNQRAAVQSGTERFELRRLQDLRTLPDSLRAWAVDVTKFERLDVPLERLSRDGSEWTVLRVRVVK